MQLYYIPVTAFSLADLLLDRISLEWDSRGSAMTNHKKLMAPELPFFRERKGILKIDQSVKMGVACSYWSAPGGNGNGNK